MTDPNTPLHIGIVACSAPGAALCYSTICSEGAILLGEHAHPEVSMHSQSLSKYVECLNADDWQGLAQLMLASAHKLASAGANLLICPDNTIHQAFDLVKPHAPLPWLHIADEVAAYAKANGFQRLGILGTTWLVQSDVYPKALGAQGLAYQRPDEQACDEVGLLIMQELVNGILKPDTQQYLVHVIHELKEQGCDAVVLGCTELPLLINEDNSPLPVVDSTRVLARAALKKATAHMTLPDLSANKEEEPIDLVDQLAVRLLTGSSA